MAARHQPSVAEPDPADALDQLVGLIEELRVEITTDETYLVKIAFSGTPHVGSALRREVRDIPGKIFRRVWNEDRRHYQAAHQHSRAR